VLVDVSLVNDSKPLTRSSSSGGGSSSGSGGGGAITFNAGSVRFAYALDDEHDLVGPPSCNNIFNIRIQKHKNGVEVDLQQLVVNIFAEQNVGGSSLQPNLVDATTTAVERADFVRSDTSTPFFDVHVDDNEIVVVASLQTHTSSSSRWWWRWWWWLWWWWWC